MNSNRNAYVQHNNCLQIELEAKRFYDEFIKELERKANEITIENMMPTKWRLLEAARSIRHHDPANVYSHLVNCISFEQHLLQQENLPENNANKVTHMIEKLLISIRQNQDVKRQWIRRCEAYLCELFEMSQDKSDIEMDFAENSDTRERNNIILDIKQSALIVQLQSLTTERQNLESQIHTFLQQAKSLTTTVIDKYLKQWKQNQKLYDKNFTIIGATLDKIQCWFEVLADSLWSIREQIKIIQSFQYQLNSQTDINCPQNLLSEMYNMATDELRKLISGSLIIEDQPPQVLKTKIRFSATLRVLIGNVLSIKINNPIVRVNIVSDAQAHNITVGNVSAKNSIGGILNSSINMDYSEATKKLTAHFRNMQLKDFKRPGKKACDNVCDEKFALSFQSTFSIGDLTMNVHALSLPVVVIVHGSQEPRGWATILWDNFFSESDRELFEVPNKVPWMIFAEALNQKCLSYNNRGLTEGNLHCLAEKLFKTTMPNPIPENFTVSWLSFCKENLPDRLFTFWDWFYSAMRLTKDHFRSKLRVSV